MKHLSQIEKKTFSFLGLGLMFLGILACSNQNKESKSNQQKALKMTIETAPFGKVDGKDVSLYTLKNDNGMEVKITNYGGIVTSIIVPDREGKPGDILLGFDSLSNYVAGHPYFGALVGRYGNRIAKGTFTLGGKTYHLAINNGENSLHGGKVGFDKKVWESEPFDTAHTVGVKLHYLSKDMEEGYPGNLNVEVTYTLTQENELKIDYRATSDKATPLNLTFHGYFNLTGCKSDVLGHEIMINAKKYVAVNDQLIPTGELIPCEGTPMDFNRLETIGSRIDQVPGGYDHSYVLNKEPGVYGLVAKVQVPENGRVMEVYSTEPGVQFYTGNFLDGTLTGVQGVPYKKHDGFCLETQHYPDSPNHPEFPSTILEPGKVYSQHTVYKFLTKK